MADFVAVLKKTLDGLGEAGPETRARVYDKARATVAAKLAAINPPPPAAVAERQKKALEDAIAAVESEYAPAKPAFEDPLEELENVFAALKEGKPIPAAKPAAPAKAAAALPPKPAPRPEPPAVTREPVLKTPAPVQTADTDFAAEDDAPFHSQERPYEAYEPRPRRRYGTAIAAVLALLVLAGGGYAAWLNKDEVTQLLGLDAASPAATTDVAEQPAAEQPAAEPPAATDVASAPREEAPADAEQASGAPAKFTQRLNADGTEVDAGPADGEATVGEGTSVAALTAPVAADQPPAVPPAPPPADTAATPDASAPPADRAAPAAPPPGDAAAVATAPADAAASPAEPAAAPSTQADQQVAVGQRAIFYEERTAVAQGSAEPGSIVWSEVQESPGGDAAPEPAIRAEATIPGKDIQLRMTIRRNADKTLPASHIIEMIFLTPEGFEGGGIDNVLRMAMKSSEQDAGNPLLGIPAKIADGFFLIALNDSPKDIETNLNLLRRQSWIDIPLVYKNGRRALFTMEKGIPGEKVFTETLKSWEPRTAG